MNMRHSGLLVVALAVLSGCNQGIPGGPGATNRSIKNAAYVQNNDSFNLSVPILGTGLKQGERKAVAIGIKRANNFDEDVALKFSELPAGVTIAPIPTVIKHGDADVKFTVTASNDAALGDFTINVTGHPTKGTDAVIGMKITVDKK